MASRVRQSLPRQFARQLGVSIAALTGVHWFLTSCFSIEPAKGPSMLPTIDLRCAVLIDKRVRSRQNLQVGDLVVYKIPIAPGLYGIKRITAMPGDFVERDTPGISNDPVMLQIPQGHCYITGDNLPFSRDSRLYGPIPLALVCGKLLAKISMPGLWPIFQWIQPPLTKVEDREQQM